jgi:hypothetical protein
VILHVTMSVAPHSPPETPMKSLEMPVHNGNPDPQRTDEATASHNSANGDAPDKVQVLSSQPASTLKSHNVAEVDPKDHDEEDNSGEENRKSINPSDLEPFDWEDLETRYEVEMTKANETEAALLKEFYEMASVSGCTCLFVICLLIDFPSISASGQRLR